MSKTTYQPGDKVVIVPDKLFVSSGDCSVTDRMIEALRGTDRVVEITKSGYVAGTDCYFVDLKSYRETSIPASCILGYAFEYGEEIEVSDFGIDWFRTTFRAYAPGLEKTVVSTGGSPWKFARPLRPAPEPRKVTMAEVCKAFGEDVVIEKED